MHTLGTDQPWVQFTGSAVGPDNASFYYSNYQGSIIAMANKDGAVTELYKYGPYGEPLVATNVAVPKQVTSSFSGNRFRFTGQTSIPEANLYYYKARIYDPIAARFLQTDPIGSKDDLNLYAYVGGDPVNRSDPLGLCKDRYRDGTCRVFNDAGVDGEAAQKAVETHLNKYDDQINGLDNKTSYDVVGSDGVSIGSFTGKELKKVWNGTRFTIVADSTQFNNGGAGGGTSGGTGLFSFNGKTRLTPKAVSAYEAVASTPVIGDSTIVFHEISHLLQVGKDVIKNNGGLSYHSGPMFDQRERETQTIGNVVAGTVGAPFECAVAAVGCQ